METGKLVRSTCMCQIWWDLLTRFRCHMGVPVGGDHNGISPRSLAVRSLCYRSYGVVWVILRLAVSVELRPVSNGLTDRHTDKHTIQHSISR